MHFKSEIFNNILQKHKVKKKTNGVYDVSKTKSTLLFIANPFCFPIHENIDRHMPNRGTPSFRAFQERHARFHDE